MTPPISLTTTAHITTTKMRTGSAQRAPGELQRTVCCTPCKKDSLSHRLSLTSPPLDNRMLPVQGLMCHQSFRTTTTLPVHAWCLSECECNAATADGARCTTPMLAVHHALTAPQSQQLLSEAAWCVVRVKRSVQTTDKLATNKGVHSQKCPLHKEATDAELSTPQAQTMLCADSACMWFTPHRLSATTPSQHCVAVLSWGVHMQLHDQSQCRGHG